MKKMKCIILILIIMGGCCNLPLVDCVRTYYYIVEEGKCENNNQSFCFSTKEINIKISPDFVNVGMNNEGNGVYQAELVISIKNQTGTEIIIDNNSFNIYCLIDNDTITTTLDTFEYHINVANKEVILTPDFVVNKKHHDFLKRHSLGVDLKLGDGMEVQSLFKIRSKRKS